MWQTPKVATGAYSYSNGNHAKPFLNLEGQAAMWATPTSRDWKDGACMDADVPTNALLGRQVLRTPTPGASGSSTAVLNPQFVEALMGFHIGWTAFAPSATPSSPKSPRSRGKCSAGG
jgi:DNA (cytosine-5)-methyltransferase 1